MNVVRPTFSPPTSRRSPLDRAHVGDIEGALGTIATHDTGPRRSRRQRLTTLLAVMGPGLVVMAADNDAGGLTVYAQAGQSHDLGYLWILLLLAPVLFINQEMVTRLGAVTGAGHARLILARFGRRWGAFAVGDLLALNALTLLTDFVGVALALQALGISRAVAVPIAGAALIALVASGSFRRWERAMYFLVALNILAVILAIVTAIDAPSSATHVQPAAAGHGFDSTTLVLLLAMIGTTVAPWQLFLQQSNVVDKRITSRWLTYSRIDTLIGTGVLVLVASCVMYASARALPHAAQITTFTDGSAVAHAFTTAISPMAGYLFALVLLNASMLGAAAVTLSSSYAVGDYFGYKHSLHRGWRDARVFYRTYTGLIIAAGTVVLIPGLPLGLLTAGVQALAGLLLPSASVFLLLLCNDRDVLGPWVNPRWLNTIASITVAILVALSATLTITIIFAEANAAHVGAGALIGVAIGLLACAAGTQGRSHPRPDDQTWSPSERATWTMPSIDALPAPAASTRRSAAMFALRAYLIVAGLVLIAKLVGLAT